MRNVLVYGAGYVGLANGLLLAKKNNVTIFDVNKVIIENLNNGILHIDDNSATEEIKNTTAKFELKREILKNEFDYVVLALPTNYDPIKNKFDTSYLDQQIADLEKNDFSGIVIIKSTVSLGYTQKKKEEYPNMKIVFSPEFLREGSSFADAKNPSRIVIGNNHFPDICNMFRDVSEGNPEIVITSSTEAEAIKLFSNTYLAMRIAFVNELATFAAMNKLDEKEIIKGVSLDPRIGSQYFEPSIGYGGYCLPKDSKQLRYEFNEKKVPSSLFDAIVESNEKRKQFVADEIINSGVKKYTIEGIGHKIGVHNYRNSPKLELAKKLRNAGIKVTIKDKIFAGKTIEGFIIT